MAGDDRVRRDALLALRTDASLAPLLPYLVAWLDAGVHVALAQAQQAQLIYLLHAVERLSRNAHVDLRPHAATLIPALVSVMWMDRFLGGRALAADPQLAQRQWHLRSFALATALAVARKDPPSLRRLIDVMRRVFRSSDARTPLVHVCMALNALCELGSGVGIPVSFTLPVHPRHRHRWRAYAVRARGARAARAAPLARGVQRRARRRPHQADAHRGSPFSPSPTAGPHRQLPALVRAVAESDR